MTIHCHDFEQAWNEKLDARRAWSAESELALREHATACPACRQIDARYRALERMLETSLRPVVVPSGFAERTLASAARHPAVTFPFPPRRWLVTVAAAAALVAAIGLSLRPWKPLRVVKPAESLAKHEIRPPVREIDTGALTAVLADATSATLSLARDASAPAARVGREVIADTDLSSPTPELILPDGVVPSVDVWQGVGARVNAGVRPLSGTARKAFGFLINAPGGQAPPAPTIPPRGALAPTPPGTLSTVSTQMPAHG